MKQMLGVALLLNSAFAAAGAMGPVAEDERYWEIGGAALYLQPAGSGLQFTPTQFLYGPANLNVGSNFNYDWGFQLEATYHYTATNDVALNWYNYQTSNRNSATQNQPVTAVLPVIATMTIDGLNENGYKSDNWNAANFEMGKHFTGMGLDKIRLHAGAQYARIKQTTRFNSTQTISGTILIVDIPSTTTNAAASGANTMNGFGPRIGVDLSHTIYNNLSAYAKGATALVAGNNHTNISGTYTGNNTGYINRSNNVVAADFEGKLGLTYEYALSQGTLIGDAGWLWVDYLNLNGVQPIAGNNFAIQGLYFGLKWRGQMA